MAFVFGATAPGGGGSFSGGTITGNTTMAAAKSFTVSTADLLTCGGKIVPQTKTITVNYAPVTSNTAANAFSFFIADETYQITLIKISYDTQLDASSTLQIQKLTGTTAAGSGTNLLTGAIALDGTINTVNTGTLTGTTANLQLAVGDRICGACNESISAGGGVNISITLKRI